MPIPLSFHVFERGVAGIPTGSFFADLSGRIDQYSHAISDTFGFETCQVSFKVTFDEGIDWLQNGIGRPVIVYSPDAEIVWEGQLTSVEATFGQEQRSRSFEQMANRVRCVYTTPLGGAGTTSSISDTGSQSLYGIKDMVLSAGTSDLGEAGYYAAVELARRAYPQSGPTTNVATGDLGDVSVTLSFTGWYGVLDWLVTSNATTSTAVTTTQVATLLTAYIAINAFLSTTTLNIIASGISTSQYIESQTTYREAIEQRLTRGNGITRLTWGVYENREFYVQAYVGATPAVITYQRFLGDARVYNAGRAIVEPWNVRPNAMYQVVELLDVGPVLTAPDSAAGFYVARTTCSIQGDSIGCTLEPEQPTDLSAILLRKY